MNSFLTSRLHKGVITFEVTGSSPSESEWEMSKILIDNWYQYIEFWNIKVGLLFLLSNLVYIKPKFLLEWKDIFNSKREKTRKYIKGSAIVVENVFIRSFVNTFFKAFKSEKPVKFVKSEKEGIEFINSLK